MGNSRELIFTQICFAIDYKKNMKEAKYGRKAL